MEFNDGSLDLPRVKAKPVQAGEQAKEQLVSSTESVPVKSESIPAQEAGGEAGEGAAEVTVEPAPAQDVVDTKS
jgi:hypothetical protein